MRWKLTFPKGADIFNESSVLASLGFLCVVDDLIGNALEMRESEEGHRLGISLDEYFSRLRQAGVKIEEIG